MDAPALSGKCLTCLVLNKSRIRLINKTGI